MNDKPVRSLRQFFSELRSSVEDLPKDQQIGLVIVLVLFLLGTYFFVSGLKSSYENGPTLLEAPPSVDDGDAAD